ncbi:Bax inhibitor-1/YccA family protein [Magnetovibrio sp. PR-2]|uniref:Bax inhibitor-1/YccA family protein n=1 Tax=Magnetovibrio sp. PR-2 TaxID=3120356 RepID=UPI002FCE374B
MAFEPQNQTILRTDTRAGTMEIDQGLRSYMLKVYNYMASGLALTGIVAMFTASSETMIQAIYGTPLQWVVMLAPLGFILFMSFGIHKMSAATAQALFWAFAAVMGLSMAWIFLVFTGASVARVFFITAGMFAGMSLYGYTTKRDLSGFGSFLFMGLIGIIIASIVNIFLESTALQFVISGVGVLVFTGLTAWDTQQIKAIYSEADSPEVAKKKAINGALRLYLDFINLFMMLLQLLGNRE